MTENKFKFLIVDEDPSNIFLLNFFFESNNFIIITANDGLEALKILHSEQNAPDLIISDIHMPNLDGYGLLAKVISDFELKNIPFIFISAGIGFEEIPKKFEKYMHISKPVKEEILITSIKLKLTSKQFTKI